MNFSFSIPTPSGPMPVVVEQGTSAIFVGANGGGKSRLAVMIEESLGMNAHRISAHRALTLNAEIPKISEHLALAGLRTGHPSVDAHSGNRVGSRWQGNSAVSLLNDFNFLLQALFADQANQSLETHKHARAGNLLAKATKFERLVELWERLLPHRVLEVSGDDIQVKVAGSEAKYKGSDMSDGERAIFYMVGQTLTALDSSLIVIDEPELHVHRSIMSKLWDELEAARPDCGFVFITHDLEFAAARIAQKFVVRDFSPAPSWVVELVPLDTGFDEDVATLILGSRRPVLFVEGDENSIDKAIYRCCFPEWTVIPRGSCEEVIHAVVTMRRNQALTRITCSGIVDADGHTSDEIANLQRFGIATLSVSEIENVILLPKVSRAIAESEGYTGADLEERLATLKRAIFETLISESSVDGVVSRYCRRRVDRFLKRIDLSGAVSVAEMVAEYGAQTALISISNIAGEARGRIEGAVKADDLAMLLADYDNKGLLALAAKYLRASKLVAFEQWLTRVLLGNKAPNVAAAIRQSLPVIVAR